MQDGSLVVVEVLKESKGNGEEFINDIASISKTSQLIIYLNKSTSINDWFDFKIKFEWCLLGNAKFYPITDW